MAANYFSAACGHAAHPATHGRAELAELGLDWRLLMVVLLLSVALVAFQFGYEIGRTVTVVDLVRKGWIPPKRP